MYSRLNNGHSEISRSDFWNRSLSADEEMELCCWDELKDLDLIGGQACFIQLVPVGGSGLHCHTKVHKDYDVNMEPREWKRQALEGGVIHTNQGILASRNQSKDQGLSC